jgi:hypothetical protein
MFVPDKHFDTTPHFPDTTPAPSLLQVVGGQASRHSSQASRHSSQASRRISFLFDFLECHLEIPILEIPILEIPII